MIKIDIFAFRWEVAGPSISLGKHGHRAGAADLRRVAHGGVDLLAPRAVVPQGRKAQDRICKVRPGMAWQSKHHVNPEGHDDSDQWFSNDVLLGYYGSTFSFYNDNVLGAALRTPGLRWPTPEAPGGFRAYWLTWSLENLGSHWCICHCTHFLVSWPKPKEQLFFTKDPYRVYT